MKDDREVQSIHLDINQMCKLAEQTIIFVSHAHQLVTHTGSDSKKANGMIEQIMQVFCLSVDKLFGDAFYQGLYHKAKSTKQLRVPRESCATGTCRGVVSCVQDPRTTRGVQTQVPAPVLQASHRGHAMTSSPFGHATLIAKTGWLRMRQGTQVYWDYQNSSRV